MITPAHTQMVMHALSMAAQVAGARANNDNDRQHLEAQAALFDAKAGVLRDLIGALVEKRVDAVRSGFSEVLAIYAEQATHFMEQQARYGDAELKSTDPLERAELRKRLGEIDIELRRIRADARRIYTQMNQITLRLGGDALSLSPDYYSTLALTDGRRASYG